MSFVREQAERLRKRAQECFHGRRYWYNTPNDGRRVIGVCQGLGGDIWIVAYVRENGAHKAVKTKHLPAGPAPDALQTSLDAWAAKRGLEEFA